MGKILVIGSLNMDMVIKVSNTPKPGETVMGKSIQYIPGGKGANQAYAAAKLGGDVAMIGAVGKDDHGDLLVNNLLDVGVDTCGIKKADMNTGLAVIYVNKAGENCIVVLAGANDTVNKAQIDELHSYIEDSEWIILQMEIPKKTVEYVIKKAASLNKKIILNPAPAPENFPDELFGMLEIITPNETELEKLTKMHVNSMDEITLAAKELNKKGVSQVIVTCGKNGALLFNSKGKFQYSAPKVTAVDTTAAGDTFTAALAVALSENKTMREAIRFANKAASISVTRSGAQSSIPSKEEVN